MTPFEDAFKVRLKPFMIISAPYIALNGDVKKNNNGTIQKGLFLVLNVKKGNVIALKITSQFNRHLSKGMYFMLCKEDNPFLQADSYIQLDKWHTLFEQHCRVIGMLCEPLRFTLYAQLGNYMDVIKLGLSNHLKNKVYISPNKIK